MKAVGIYRKIKARVVAMTGHHFLEAKGTQIIQTPKIMRLEDWILIFRSTESVVFKV